jgi:transcriptional regulator with XRE-family HTH domain
MYKPLDAKKIGQSIAKLRRHREIKASELAAHLNMAEQTYTRYERGETPITLQVLNSVAQFFDVDPLEFIANGPESIVENIHNSLVSNNHSSITTNIDKDLLEALKLQLAEKDKQIAQQLSVIVQCTAQHI